MTEDEYDEMQMLRDAGTSYPSLAIQYGYPAWLLKMRLEDDEEWLRRHWADSRKYDQLTPMLCQKNL